MVDNHKVGAEPTLPEDIDAPQYALSYVPRSMTTNRATDVTQAILGASCSIRYRQRRNMMQSSHLDDSLFDLADRCLAHVSLDTREHTSMSIAPLFSFQSPDFGYRSSDIAA